MTVLQTDTSSARGVYDLSDSIIDYYADSDPLTDYTDGRRIVDHEFSHFFQNYFTAVGQSHYHLLRLVNAVLDDLLIECRGRLVLPFIPWLYSADSPIISDRHLLLFDRLIRLLIQLQDGSGSQKIIRENSARLESLHIMTLVERSGISLDAETRTVCVDRAPLFQIDYSAICESMAKAMEYYNASQNLVRHQFGIPYGQSFSEDQMYVMRDVLRGMAVVDLENPLVINYTYPLLILRQSGFNITEAMTIVVCISYVALMSQWSVPAIPEVGIEEPRRFGTMASTTYTKLLLAACQDDFVEPINAFGSVLAAGGSVVDYLDGWCAKAAVPALSEMLAEFVELTETWERAWGRDDSVKALGDDWYVRILSDARLFVHELQASPVGHGLNLLHSPSILFGRGISDPLSSEESDIGI